MERERTDDEAEGGSGRWTVEVDHGLCIGSGLCVSTAPDAFQLNSARQARPLATRRDADDGVLSAAEGCPAEAILITLTATDEPVFPPDE
ncbi:ferredoxin [Streptomyces sp. HNM0574]|uniref:ferredoxin n=1 Tax=Streptomyces sp. HNM0574 TaxID=2714954 RepID=UPI00146B1918|nr:ferredoxin [Streptomyces sp. HNM0574]